MFSDPIAIVRQLKLDPGMRVADFGAGSGQYSFALAEAVTGAGKVYSVDVQKNLLAKIKNESIKRHLLSIEPVWGDIDKQGGSTLRDNSCDVVVMANILFQLEQKETALKEAYRVLKPRGRLLIVDWSESFGGIGPSSQLVVKEYVAKDLVEKTGFTMEGAINAGSHHYGFIARKQ